MEIGILKRKKTQKLESYFILIYKVYVLCIYQAISFSLLIFFFFYSEFTLQLF